MTLVSQRGVRTVTMRRELLSVSFLIHGRTSEASFCRCEEATVSLARDTEPAWRSRTQPKYVLIKFVDVYLSQSVRMTLKSRCPESSRLRRPQSLGKLIKPKTPFNARYWSVSVNVYSLCSVITFLSSIVPWSLLPLSDRQQLQNVYYSMNDARLLDVLAIWNYLICDRIRVSVCTYNFNCSRASSRCGHCLTAIHDEATTRSLTSSIFHSHRRRRCRRH